MPHTEERDLFNKIMVEQVLPIALDQRGGKPYKPELRRHAAEHAIAERLAPLGVGGVHAELADGIVTVTVPHTGHKSAVVAALDAYAITWRFEPSTAAMASPPSQPRC